MRNQTSAVETMIRIYLSAGAVVAALIFLDGCGTPRGAQQDGGNEIAVRPGTQASLAVYERTLNPSDFDEDVAQVKETQPDSLKPVPAEVTEPDSVVVEEVVTQGFRIQIYASKKIDDATAVRAKAANQFPQDSIYVVYDPPVYRVRIGDFPTRVEASRRLPSISSEGYADAWVVSDRILIRKTSARP